MNHLHVTFVLSSFYFFHPIFPARAPTILQRRKAFMVEYFEKCENKGYPWEATNFSFVRDDTSLHMNGWVLVNRDIRDPISLQIKMDRCKDRTDLSSCEHVTSIKWPDLCGAVKLIPNFRIFFDALEPPLSCPVKKNRYFVRDSVLPLDIVSTFLTTARPKKPLSKVHCTLYEGNRLISCLAAGWRIRDIKIRS
ncbi:unnamed protein product [Bemisia tabaci]|uniref:Uncharacterized protein n=2 Tax=Bemisia tabaci TaxID=7038 RepID=A0A9P0A7D8_BEMTA|nr:unnamed protein product [Bemisia tabaci]